MSRMDLPRWSLAVALLLTPAALGAQAPTVVCKDGSSAPTAAACARHGGLDSVATTTAQRARGGPATATVVCKDGTTGTGTRACASHGGVDSIMTNAARKARGETGPVESGRVDTTMNPPRQAGTPRDTSRTRIKMDTNQPGMADTNRHIRVDTARTRGDTTK